MSQNHSTAEVISYLRRKSSDGNFESISWIGAEQRFVKSLRNSGINNLEEQYIAGTNTYTVEYVDQNGDYITEISYCTLEDDQTPEDVSNYYKLIITKYDKANLKLRYYFDIDNHAFMIPDAPDEVEITSEGNIGTLECKDSDVFKITTTSPITGKTITPTLLVTDDTFVTIQKEELWYIKSNNNSYKILTKETKVRYTDDNKKITKKVITYDSNYE